MFETFLSCLSRVRFRQTYVRVPWLKFATKASVLPDFIEPFADHSL